MCVCICWSFCVRVADDAGACNDYEYIFWTLFNGNSPVNFPKGCSIASDCLVDCFTEGCEMIVFILLRCSWCAQMQASMDAEKHWRYSCNYLVFEWLPLFWLEEICDVELGSDDDFIDVSDWRCWYLVFVLPDAPICSGLMHDLRTLLVVSPTSRVSFMLKTNVRPLPTCLLWHLGDVDMLPNVNIVGL